MKSFLDDRQNVGNGSSGKGKITKGGHFQPISASTLSSQLSGGAGQKVGSVEEVSNPDNGPNAPKVEFIKEGDVITRIIVTFGEQVVEIDCQS